MENHDAALENGISANGLPDRVNPLPPVAADSLTQVHATPRQPTITDDNTSPGHQDSTTTLTLLSASKRALEATHELEPPIKKLRVKSNHVCRTHHPTTAVQCFGKVGKGIRRCRQNISTFIEGQLPVCERHKSQVGKLRYCEAIMDCKLPCKNILEDKPHGFSLCEAHQSLAKCWIQVLPIEVRLMIYRYLIPDQVVLARRETPEQKSQASICTELLRVNKKIHDEVADLLYGQSCFEIELVHQHTRVPAYQGVLFKVENCILMCGAELEKGTRNLSELLIGVGGDVKIDFLPQRSSEEATWKPALSDQYFKRVKYFRLKILFGLSIPLVSRVTDSSLLLAKPPKPNAEEIGRGQLLDSLHSIVDALSANNQLPLNSLDVSVFIDVDSGFVNPQDESEQLQNFQILISPMLRLRARTASINCFIGWSTPMMHAFSPMDPNLFESYVENCRVELTNLLVSPRIPPILAQCRQVCNIRAHMVQHPYWLSGDIMEINSFSDSARLARENNNPAAMKVILEDVLQKLDKYNSVHVAFMEQMKERVSAAAICNSK